MTATTSYLKLAKNLCTKMQLRTRVAELRRSQRRKKNPDSAEQLIKGDCLGKKKSGGRKGRTKLETFDENSLLFFTIFHLSGGIKQTLSAAASRPPSASPPLGTVEALTATNI